MYKLSCLNNNNHNNNVYSSKHSFYDHVFSSNTTARFLINQTQISVSLCQRCVYHCKHALMIFALEQIIVSNKCCTSINKPILKKKT